MFLCEPSAAAPSDNVGDPPDVGEPMHPSAIAGRRCSRETDSVCRMAAHRLLNPVGYGLRALLCVRGSYREEDEPGQPELTGEGSVADPRRELVLFSRSRRAGSER